MNGLINEEEDLERRLAIRKEFVGMGMIEMIEVSLYLLWLGFKDTDFIRSCHLETPLVWE